MSSTDDRKILRAIATCPSRQGCGGCGTPSTCLELHRKVEFRDCLARRRRGECEAPKEKPEKLDGTT
jgi:hypothetical protein